MKSDINKKISVIIPVYNTERYVERCVRSVMNQTYQNLEIICVNDGSKDNSGKVLDQLANEDDRIVVIHQKNEGVSVARNKALFCSTGDYITFVDSDDYIDSYMYEKMVSKIESSGADIVTCGYNFDNRGKITVATNLRKVPENALPVRDFLIYMYERDVYKGVAGYLWTRMVKRELLFHDKKTPQILFKSEYDVAEDIIFIAEMTIAARKIAYLNENLYYYFQRDGSIVHDEKKQLETLHWIKGYEKIIEIYNQYGAEEVVDYIVRMYVYRCGKTLECAYKFCVEEKIPILKEKIKKYLTVYVNANLEHLDRVKWIEDLLMKEEE